MWMIKGDPCMPGLSIKPVDVAGMENPTAENITIWFWNQLKPRLQVRSRIELKETPTTGVIYDGQ